MKVGREVPPFGVRLPSELKNWLKKEAEKNRRSLNSEILIQLETAREKSTAAKDSQP